MNSSLKDRETNLTARGSGRHDYRTVIVATKPAGAGDIDVVIVGDDRVTNKPEMFIKKDEYYYHYTIE